MLIFKFIYFKIIKDDRYTYSVKVKLNSGMNLENLHYNTSHLLFAKPNCLNYMYINAFTIDEDPLCTCATGM